MAQVPEEEIFWPTTPALWVKNFILYYHLNLKQYKTVHYRIQDRMDTTGTVRYLTDIQSINQLFMSCMSVYQDHAMGGKKGDYFPHTQLGSESRG